MTSYYRIQTADRSAADLIDPERAQISYHWSGFEANDRPGVSVCRSPEDLAAYLASSGIPYGDGAWVIVELDGPVADGVTAYDAASGEVLIWPETIVSVTPMGDEFFEMIGAAYDAAAA